MVSKARLDLPLPLGPVITWNRFSSRSRLIPLRLFWRAPRIITVSRGCSADLGIRRRSYCDIPTHASDRVEWWSGGVLGRAEFWALSFGGSSRTVGLMTASDVIQILDLKPHP